MAIRERSFCQTAVSQSGVSIYYWQDWHPLDTRDAAIQGGVPAPLLRSNTVGRNARATLLSEIVVFWIRVKLPIFIEFAPHLPVEIPFGRFPAKLRCPVSF
jgi:hypothetical protein